MLEMSGYFKGVVVSDNTLTDLPNYEKFEVEQIVHYKQVTYVTAYGDEGIEEVEDEEAGMYNSFPLQKSERPLTYTNICSTNWIMTNSFSKNSVLSLGNL